MKTEMMNLPNFTQCMIKVKTTNDFITDCESNKIMNDFVFFHTEHSQLRSKQRKIPDDLIELAISFGKNIETPSSSYYVFSKKYLDNITESVKKKISNLVVIIAKKHNVIITCFYCNNPMKLIKKKSKHFIYN